MANHTDLIAIYNEFIEHPENIEFNIDKGLNFTYSSRDSFYSIDNMISKIESKQLKAFKDAVRTYEEIIPIQFSRLDSLKAEDSINNIKLYNADINYRAFSNSSTSTAATKTLIKYITRTINGIPQPKEITHIDRLIIYNHNQKGQSYIQNAKNNTNYLYHTYRHELGHALGLDHPDSHDDTTMKHTVMSYSFHPSYQINGFYPVTPLLLDTLVLQAAYGQNYKTRSGDNYYSWNNKELSKIRCLWDASGQDTFDLEQSKHACFFDMRDGQFSSIGSHPWGAPADSNFSLAYTTELENLKGTEKGDTVFLNRHNNIINLGKGNDTIYLSDRSIHTSISAHSPEKIHQSVEYGWGNDIYYSRGGKDRFIIDVLDPTKLKFIKRNKSLKIAYRDRNSKISSITIANYHPNNHLLLVRTSSKPEEMLVRHNFRTYVKRSKQKLNQNIFSKLMMGVRGNLSKRIHDYDKTMSSIDTSLKINNHSAYVPLTL